MRPAPGDQLRRRLEAHPAAATGTLSREASEPAPPVSESDLEQSARVEGWSPRLCCVQLAYLDESKASRAYFITALVVTDRDSVAWGRALDEVVEWAQGTYGRVSERAELRAVDLAGGQGDGARYRDKLFIPARVAVYERAVAAIANFDVRVYIRGADIAPHQSRYAAGTDIHGTVLPWVLERVQDDAAARDDLALVIADDHQLRERYRSAIRESQRWGTSGWKPAVLDRIADTLHFAPSHASRLLQARQMCAI